MKNHYQTYKQVVSRSQTCFWLQNRFTQKNLSFYCCCCLVWSTQSNKNMCESRILVLRRLFFCMVASWNYIRCGEKCAKQAFGQKREKKWKFPPVTHSNDTKRLFFFIIVTTKTNITFTFLYAALISPISFKLYETSEIKHTRKKLERVWRVDLYKGINTVACFFKWYYLSEELHNAFFPLILRRVTQSQNISEHLKKSIS